MPLIEELDQEVMVIDQPEADVRTAEPIPTDPDSIASMQVVLATALGLDSAR